MKLDKNLSLNDVENILPLKTWYASIFVLPFAKRLILFFSKTRILTPNQITIVSLFFKIISAYLFTIGKLRFAAFFYYISYLLDCVDGGVARLTNQVSILGRYLDHISDLIGDIIVLCSLAYNQNLIKSYMILGMVFMHISESYISYLMSFVKKDASSKLSKVKLLKIFDNYRHWWFKKNYKSFFSFPDYTAFTFILMPLLGYTKNGLKIGFFFLFFIVCYTILSTFVSLHTNNNRFP